MVGIWPVSCAQVPEDQVGLRFLLGERKSEMQNFAATNNLEQVMEEFFSAWPEEWTSMKPKAANQLRVIYGGGVRPGTTQLSSLVNGGSTAIMHLHVAPEGLPEAATSSMSKSVVC
ncbi:hypothetical protein SARC_13323 [Sphaeroforma arctica JP610]|uniref:UBL3-like ubiquitin domain-containing protein n=1 Tax=Sphaeroforma arctica JP610 TaxID=667725 RepID=A0A0L0FBJ8_9EUKA|nr:hypothetical protein SARC_13323 [Sphaeroforma arctica JP610]KNC74120.1 hypothetical protein SARC_13323 [Sphaeroforma arctica JP610]|eukprot:XP_014148022.1 hypothetical protein SARC_13323 [Sphaeroforma arctica JP610]